MNKQQIWVLVRIYNSEGEEVLAAFTDESKADEAKGKLKAWEGENSNPRRLYYGEQWFQDWLDRFPFKEVCDGDGDYEIKEVRVL